MSPVRFAFLALLGAQGCVAGVVRPKQPVVHQSHAEAKHATLPSGKISPKGPRDTSKKTATKQAPSPHAPTNFKLVAHGEVPGVKHSKLPVAHQDNSEATIVTLSAKKASSQEPFDDDVQKLGKAYARAFGKSTAKKQAPNPHVFTRSEQDKLAAHREVGGVKHSKRTAVQRDEAEATIVNLSAAKTSSEEPLDEDAQKLGTAYARGFGKNTAKKRAPSLHAATMSKHGKLAAHGEVVGVMHPKRLVAHQDDADAIVTLSAGKTSSDGPPDDDAHELGEAYARAFGKAPSLKKRNTSEVSSTQPPGKGDTSPKIQDLLSDNAEHMIAAAMDSDSMDVV